MSSRARLRVLSLWFVAVALASCGGGGERTEDIAKDAGIDVQPVETIDYGEPGDAREDGEATPEVPQEVPCIPECTTAGDRQCVPGVQGMYQVCEEQEGCLAWGAAQQCPGSRACVQGQCLEVCESDPGCDQAGDRRCGSSTAFQACEEVSSGCFKYGAEQECPAAMACVGDGACQCQHACPAVGDRRCFAAEQDLYQECVENPSGCRVWSDAKECGQDSVCVGAGVCQPVCTSECDPKGALQCASGTTYQVCMEVQPGCLKWGDASPCPGTLTCQDGQCQVACIPDAGCDVPGTLRCADLGHQQACEQVVPGCLKFGAPEACPLHQACTGTRCECGNPCTQGQAECLPEVDPHDRKVCEIDPDGCTYWSYQDCGGGANCEGGQCVAICGSDPGCTAVGVTRCESLDSFSTCAEVAGHAGCIQFGAAAACPDHQQCDDVTGACACRVEGGCTAAGARRCVDYDNAAECLQDANGCLYWGAPQACPEGSTCSQGTCSPLCVSDLDCPATGTHRCSPTGQLRTCVEVPGAPGCIKWAPDQDCPQHQVCLDPAGCVCDDPCVSGQSRCLGLRQRQSCAAADALGCTYWGDPVACDAADSCVQGDCRRIVSPVVHCGEVTLNLVNQGYSEVFVSGNFQGPAWQSVNATLVDGVWTATFPVAATFLQPYKFIADGTWLLDPLNPATVGTPPLDNSAVEVVAVSNCTQVGATRCTADGALEACDENAGCPAWKPAVDPCTAPDRYCADGLCHPLQSPVVTATEVSFTVRDQGFAVEVGGDFTNPAWGTFFQMTQLAGRRSVTLLRADVPGLTAGRHAYKFHAPVAQYWFFDPANPEKEDDSMGGYNSIVTIPSDCVPGCGTVGLLRCKDQGVQQECALDGQPCPDWRDQACASWNFCLREQCEALPAIDGTARTATFVLPHEDSTSIQVRGSFTNPPWDEGGALSMSVVDGAWVATTGPLAPGPYQYKFVRNGSEWFPDPFNPDQVDDGQGGKNSVFTIP